MMGDLTKNFSRREFRCRCGRKKCDAAPLDMRLVVALQALRDVVGHSIDVASGVRCREHNRRVGGAPGSKHLEGIAADIKCAELSPVELRKFAEEIPAFANGGIGIYDWGIHVDVRGKRARWDYRTKRK